MQREDALAAAAGHFDSGRFRETLARRIALATESEEPSAAPLLRQYLSDELGAQLSLLGFDWTIETPPNGVTNLFLVGERIEDPALRTVLIYGHGDVVRGQADRWHAGLSPWQLVEREGRWYGRGSADNKGQHTIHLDALAQVLRLRRGRLGFNVKVLFEMGEETGSPGLAAFAAANLERLGADILIASDGPRVSSSSPTLFLGARGIVDATLIADFRPGGHHSGNWGGLLPNPATVLCNLIASWVDGKGRLRHECFKPDSLTPAVRKALANVPLESGPHAPVVDPDWGEPGLTPAERVYAWNTLEVLAIGAGNAERPVNAIPGQARAKVQLRYVVGTDVDGVMAQMQRSANEFSYPGLSVRIESGMPATRMEPDHPLVVWAAQSLRKTTGKVPTVLPNLGGSLPNDVFADVLGLPTLWVPHSYPACSQHAPNEHLLPEVAREGLQIMAGLYFDLGEPVATGGAPQTSAA